MAQTAASPSSSSSALVFRCSLPSPSDAFPLRFTDRGMSRMPHQYPASPEMPASPPFVFPWFTNAASSPRPAIHPRSECLSLYRRTSLISIRPACLGPPPTSACVPRASPSVGLRVRFLSIRPESVLPRRFPGDNPPEYVPGNATSAAGRTRPSDGSGGSERQGPTPEEEAEGGAARRRRPRVRWRSWPRREREEGER